MCGIVGLVESGAGGPDLGLLQRMAAEIAHRGPDDEGFMVEGNVGLGHRRLAIIDLAGSRQPMTSADGNFTITFNGEILNYRELRDSISFDWTTTGDTEVLLELLARSGVNALTQLRGQFAFALFDRRDGSVLLARDRMGILPLFYAETPTRFAFSSEAKALRPALDTLTVDASSMHDYLSQRAVAAPFTLLAGVRKVMPGSWLRVMPDGRTEHGRYWSLNTKRAPLRLTASEAVDELERLLMSAVQDALVADVPVGAYLSGGVDSSIIVALAAKAAIAGQLSTFTATFPGSVDDEGAYARRVSAQLGTDHHEIAVEPAMFYSELWRLAWYRDLPISQTSDVAVAALARLASQHVKVVISGEGSDELFAGYPKYRAAKVGHAVGLVPAAIRVPPIRLARKLFTKSHDRLDTALRALEGRAERERLDGWFASYSQADLNELCPTASRHERAVDELHGDAVQRMGLVDLTSWLADNLLERGDRMTMAASIELRPPFLDPRVVEFALALPSRIKLHHRTPKWPVREVARRFVDADIIDRPKVGFKVPIGEWFRTSLAEEVRELLQSSQSRSRELLNGPTIDRLIDDHLTGRADRTKQLWPLVSLEVWARSVVENSPTAHPTR